jgi:hypothetical protein
VKKLFYDGKDKEHVKIIEDALSFIDRNKYSIVCKGFWIKIYPKGSRTNFQIISIQRPEIKDGKMGVCRVYLNAFRLIRNSNTLTEQIYDEIDILEDKVCLGHYGTKKIVCFRDMSSEDIKLFYYSELFARIDQAFRYFSKHLQKQFEQMKQEFE